MQANRVIANISSSTIVFDSVSGNGALTNSTTWSHTTTGTNLILIVGVQIFDSGGATTTVSSVKYNNVDLTQLRSTTDSTYERNDIWYMVNPPTGTYTVAVALSATKYVTATAITLRSIDTDNPIDNHNGNSGTGASPSVSLTTNVPDCWTLSFVGQRAGPGHETTTQTERREQTFSSVHTGSAATRGPVAAGSNTLGWTSTGTSNWAISGVSIRKLGALTTYSKNNSVMANLKEASTPQASSVKANIGECEKRYWIGGSGNWSDTAHWSKQSGGLGGASAPTEIYDVVFDTNSGLSNQEIILDGSYYSAVCHDFTATTGVNFAITYSTSDLSIYGSAVFESGLTFTANGSITTYVYFSSEFTETITTNNCTLATVYFGDPGNNGQNATWELMDDLHVSSEIDFYGGTFHPNNHNLTAANYYFKADTGYTPTIYMGSGTWEATGTGNVWEVNESNGQHITLYCETSTIKITNNTASLKKFWGGYYTYNTVWVSGTGSGGVLLTDENTYAELKADTPPVTLYFKNLETHTIGTLSIIGTEANPIVLDTDTSTGYFEFTKPSGTASVRNATISHSHAIGGATWYAINSINGGSNTGWVFYNDRQNSVKANIITPNLTVANSVRARLFWLQTNNNSVKASLYIPVTQQTSTKANFLVTTTNNNSTKANILVQGQRGANLMLNPDFETAGAGGVDAFANWSESVSGASTITADTTNYHTGKTSAKMSVDASNSLVSLVSSTISLTGQTRYKISFWYKSDVAGQIEFQLRDRNTPTNALYLQADGSWTTNVYRFAINTTTDWQEYVLEFSTYIGQTQIQISDLKRTGSGPSQANKTFWFDTVLLYTWNTGNTAKANIRATQITATVSCANLQTTTLQDNTVTASIVVTNSFAGNSKANISAPGQVAVITETMQSAPSGTLVNGTVYDAVNKWVQLTSATNSVNGELVYTDNANLVRDNFIVEAEIWTGGGNGADAQFFFFGATSTPTVEDGTTNGYIIAFDEYSGSPGSIQINYNGSSLVADTTVSKATLQDSNWHAVRIIVNGTNFKIYFDRTLIVDYTDSVRTLGGTRYGWGARTGGLNNEHRLRALAIAYQGQPVFSKADIRAVVTQENSVCANLIVKGEAQSSSKANILFSTIQDQSAKANLRVTTTQITSVKQDILVTPSPRRYNLVLNPSFEADIVGQNPALWTAFNTAGTPFYKGVANDIAYAGTQSVKIKATTSVDTGWWGRVSGIPIGSTVKASAYVKTDSAVTNACFVLNNGQHGLGGSQGSTQTLTANYDGLVTATITGLTTTALDVFLGLGAFGGQSTGTVWFDAIIVEVTEETPLYFDGSFENATWTGTEHGSVSYLSGARNTAKASIVTTNTFNTSQKGNFLAVYNKDISSKASLQATGQQVTTPKANIRVNNTTQNQTVRVDIITKNLTDNCFAKANLLAPVPQNHLVKINIRVNNNQQINSVLTNIRVNNNLSVTSAKANLVAVLTQNNNSRADLQQIYQSDTVCIGDIKVTASNQLTAKANLQATTKQAQASKANITTPQANLVKADIKVQNAYDTYQKGNIQARYSYNQQVQQNIRATITSTNSVKGNLLVSTIVSVQCKADILVSNSNAQTVKVNLLVPNTKQAQSVKAYFFNIRTQNNSSKANLTRFGVTLPSVATANLLVTDIATDQYSKASIVVTEQRTNVAQANFYNIYEQAGLVKANINRPRIITHKPYQTRTDAVYGWQSVYGRQRTEV